MRLSKRVYLIASGRLGCSLTHPSDCNAYAVDCGGEWVIIDSGVGLDTGALLQIMRDDGIPAGRVPAVLLTHGHLDHAGGAAELAQTLNTEIWASEETAAALESGDEQAISLAEAKEAGIYGPEFQLRRCAASRRFSGGEKFSIGDLMLEVIRTPGHARDHVTYLLGDDAFPGDTVFHGGRVLISPTWDCDPAAYGQSLLALRNSAIAGLYPGHGLWSVRDGGDHINAAASYVDRLLLPPNLF